MEPKEESTKTSPQVTTLKRNKDNKTMAKTFKKILKPGEKKKKRAQSMQLSVKSLIGFLETNCIELEGICRISGNNVKVKELKKQFENSNGSCEDIDLSKFDPHVVSGTMKAFLRDSDEPLLTFDLYKNFLASIDIKDKNAKISFIKSLFSALPKENLDLLQILLKFLYTIQLHSSKNKMTCSNLAIVFSPTLLRPREESLETMMTDSNNISEVVKVLIEEFHVLYEIKQTILYQVSALDLGIKEDKRSTSEQLEDAKVSIEQLKKHLDEEARERSILETYCTSLEQKLLEMQDQNKSITEEKDSLGELLNEFKETNKNQSGEITVLKSNVVEIEEKQSKTESEKNEIIRLKNTIEKNLESKLVELKQVTEQNQSLKVNVNKLNTDLQNQIKEFESFKTNSKKERELESQQHNQVQQQYKEQNQSLKDEMIQLQRERTEASSEVERVQAEISLLLSASNDKASKKNSLKIQKRDLDSALKRCKEQESKISTLEKEKSKLSDEITKLQKTSSSTPTPTPAQPTHKFVFGKKPSNKNQQTTTTTTTTTSPPSPHISAQSAPPPIDEDDLISVKKFAFYYMNLFLKTDAMVKGNSCNINSAEVLEELLDNKIKVSQWSDLISKKLKEIK